VRLLPDVGEIVFNNLLAGDCLFLKQLLNIAK
jgi:hypothetical protein